MQTQITLTQALKHPFRYPSVATRHEGVVAGAMRKAPGRQVEAVRAGGGAAGKVQPMAEGKRQYLLSIMTRPMTTAEVFERMEPQSAARAGYEKYTMSSISIALSEMAKSGRISRRDSGHGRKVIWGPLT